MAGETRGSFFEAIFGFAFCSPSFLYVIAMMQKSVLLGWFLGALYKAQGDHYCVETLYSAFARPYKQGGMDGTSARQLKHRQALICMFLRFPRDTVPIATKQSSLPQITKSFHGVEVFELMYMVSMFLLNLDEKR